MRIERTGNGGTVSAGTDLCGRIVHSDNARGLDLKHYDGDVFILFEDMKFDNGDKLCSGILVAGGRPEYVQVDVRKGDEYHEGSIIGSGKEPEVA